MTNVQQRREALTGSACPENAAQPVELFYVHHPEVSRALLGPFLSRADAECGRKLLRSADAVVRSALVDEVSQSTRWHAWNNGEVCRAFCQRQERVSAASPSPRQSRDAVTAKAPESPAPKRPRSNGRFLKSGGTNCCPDEHASAQ
ncbi:MULTISPECIES: hypothetical protein [Pseudomonas]|uniref:hypothetical protein n=1 Tax=Pseudomonas TaxID=286 RepID=UPI0007A7EFA4|nr:hypothetical protein [Pseudomonas aeruginosa]KYO88306.1 hypothetical protein LT19_03940 [Pseudomonas aeruginosa]MDQ9104462.1 hypothetical protein [Pseudomonas aeruginosa]MDV7898603.1 hypothetical protein [Pseudomonas aeruginosa]MDY1273513.1 hypothetical protein [Pseudomonas aeruginosa]MDY1568612.1 hypothetical protein [Pseudomonas aeruginosa]